MKAFLGIAICFFLGCSQKNPELDGHWRISYQGMNDDEFYEIIATVDIVNDEFVLDEYWRPDLNPGLIDYKDGVLLSGELAHLLDFNSPQVPFEIVEDRLEIGSRYIGRKVHVDTPAILEEYLMINYPIEVNLQVLEDSINIWPENRFFLADLLIGRADDSIQFMLMGEPGDQGLEKLRIYRETLETNFMRVRVFRDRSIPDHFTDSLCKQIASMGATKFYTGYIPSQSKELKVYVREK